MTSCMGVLCRASLGLPLDNVQVVDVSGAGDTAPKVSSPPSQPVTCLLFEFAIELLPARIHPYLFYEFAGHHRHQGI